MVISDPIGLNFSAVLLELRHTSFERDIKCSAKMSGDDAIYISIPVKFLQVLCVEVVFATDHFDKL